MVKPRRITQCKKAIAGQMMLQHPKLSLSAIIANLKQKNHTMSLPYLCIIRSKLRKEGHNLPRGGKIREELMQNKPEIKLIKLGSKTEAVIKAIYHNPRKSPKEIKKMLANKNIKVELGIIYKNRPSMKRWFPEIDFSVKPKPIKLTKPQEAMIPGFIRLARKAIYFKGSKKWTLETQKEFREFVLARIIQMVKKFKSKRANEKTFINKEVGFLRKEFVRQSIKNGMGITELEAKLVIRIIREKARGNKNHTKIAKKLECEKGEVDELWRAYQLYQRIQGRTGKKKEQ